MSTEDPKQKPVDGIPTQGTPTNLQSAVEGSVTGHGMAKRGRKAGVGKEKKGMTIAEGKPQPSQKDVNVQAVVQAPLNLPVLRLSPETQTILAELLEHLRGTEFFRSFSDLDGAFLPRLRGALTYWYFRTTGGVGAQVKEFYIGPDDEKTNALLEAYRAGRPAAEARADRMTRLAAMLRVSGVAITDRESTKIIKGFSEAGVFRLGGTLIPESVRQTQDNSKYPL